MARDIVLVLLIAETALFQLATTSWQTQHESMLCRIGEATKAFSCESLQPKEK